jgi:glycosyltransferase involved in cell wall biosynthesis
VKNILHFSSDDFGGAGSAAVKLHNNLKSNGFNSLLLCLNKKTNHSDIIKVHSSSLKIFFEKIVNKLEVYTKFFNRKYYFFDKNRNLIKSIKDIESVTQIKPDIIILHWISGLIDISVIKQLQERYDCKVYWYLMDMAPMTGGCHYAWDCIGYTKSCSSCPAVGLVYKNLPLNTMKHKQEILSAINIEPISASRWLNRQLKKSSLFKESNIHEIMLSINSDIFKPLDQNNVLEIKKKYNLPVNKKVIFFGASNPKEERKGLKYFLDALELIASKKLIDIESTIVVTAGKKIPKSISKKITFPHKHIGYLNGDKELAEAYQIATVFVSSSIQDSGPMMINESIMCGTPVVSFRMGVAEDLVINGETGYIAELKSFKDLANGISKIINLNYLDNKEMRERCRELAFKKCRTDIQTKKFISLLSE